MDSTGQPVTASPLGNPYRFHGLKMDGETGSLGNGGGNYFDPLTACAIRGKVKNVRDIGGSARAIEGNNPWSSDYVNKHGLQDKKNRRMINADAKLVRAASGSGTPLQSFFERGDKPTQSQFAPLIDSTVNKITDRYLLGLSDIFRQDFGPVQPTKR